MIATCYEIEEYFCQYVIRVIGFAVGAVHIAKQFRHFRVGHIGHACDYAIRVADNLDIDGSLRVYVQCIKGLFRPYNVQKKSPGSSDAPED